MAAIYCKDMEGDQQSRRPPTTCPWIMLIPLARQERI